MGVIDVFKKIFKHNKVPQLNEGKENIVDDTVELITIAEIERVLKDDNAFKELRRNIKEGKEPSNGISCDTYLQGIRDYAMFFLQRGIVLDQKMLKKINKITKEKFKNNKERQQKDSIEVMATKLIYAPDEESTNTLEVKSVKDVLRVVKKNGANEYLLYTVSDGHATPADLKKGVIEVSNDLKMFSNVLTLNQSMISEIQEIQHDGRPEDKSLNGEEVIQNKIKFEPEKYSVNEDLKKLIGSKVSSKTSNKAQLAYEIYKAVCLVTEYDTGYFIKKSDKFSEDFLKRLKGRDISELNPQKKRLICTKFSELLCYMLNDYGINANIIENKSKGNMDKDVCHWYVQINLDNDVIYADATNGVVSGGVNMIDMSRVKLGLPPGNFISVAGKNYPRMFEKEVEKDAVGYSLQPDIDLIEELMIKTGKERKQVSIQERIDIMRQQLQNLKGANLGNYATTQYMTSLFDRVMQDHTRENKIGISKSLYKQDAEDVYSYYPIIFVENNQGDFSYYAYDEEHGLKKVEKETLLEKINSKELNIVVGKEDRIPGLNTNSRTINNKEVKQDIIEQNNESKIVENPEEYMER